MRFSMLYSGEQILSFKSCLVFYAGDSLKNELYFDEWDTSVWVRISFRSLGFLFLLLFYEIYIYIYFFMNVFLFYFIYLFILFIYFIFFVFF